MESRGISPDIGPQRSKGNIAIFPETPLDMCIIPEAGRNIAKRTIMLIQKNNLKGINTIQKVGANIVAKRW